VLRCNLTVANPLTDLGLRYSGQAHHSLRWHAACGDLNDSFGLPTVTLTAGAAANLVNITGSNIIFRDLELDPVSGGQPVPIGVNVTGGNVTLINLRLLEGDAADYTTAAIVLGGASGRASGNRVEGAAADCIQVTAGTYTVEGNTLRRCGDDGIDITGGSGHTIGGNTIFSAGNVGIFVDSAQHGAEQRH
jgi:parallel beta-helix repeat protein